MVMRVARLVIKGDKNEKVMEGLNNDQFLEVVK